MKLNKKVFLSMSLVFLMVFSGILSTFAVEMTDLNNNWAKDTIKQWINHGFISGYEDGTFRPDSKISRAEFIKLINRSMGFNEEGDISYKDVNSDDWFYKDVQIANKAGYITGHSPEVFAPNEPITREQATAILVRIKDLVSNTDAISKFSDKEKISDWAKGFVGAAVEVEYIKGYTDGTFKATSNLTRAEAVHMLDGVINSKNIIVDKADQEVKDIVVEGKLIITKALGEANAYIKNVEVDEIVINGGGANSLYFENVNANNIIVNKMTPARLVFSDKSKVNCIEIYGNAIVESSGASIIDEIIVNTSQTIVLRGTIKNVTIESGSTVMLEGAKIENMIIDGEITLEMDKNSKIDLLQANVSVSIYGQGTIEVLQANANDIMYEVKINKIEVAENVTNAPTKISDAPVSGGGGSVTPPATQKILSVKIEKGETTLIRNVEYKSDDTLKVFSKRNSDLIVTALNELNVKSIKINNNEIFSETVFDKIAEILEIDKNSESYKDLKKDFSIEVIVSKLVDKSDKLLQHIRDNEANIIENITDLDLSNFEVEKGGKTVTLDEIDFSVKFGSEAEIVSLENLLDELSKKADDLINKKIDDLSFSKVVIKIGTTTITVERTTK